MFSESCRKARDFERFRSFLCPQNRGGGENRDYHACNSGIEKINATLREEYK